jgi:hypothetical protein
MLKFIAKLVFCSGLSYIAYTIGGLPVFMLSVPPWALLFAPYLVDTAPFIRDQARRDVLLPWHGRYYAFNGKQIRFFFVNEQIWVPVNDVAALMLPPAGDRELRLQGEDYALIPDAKEMGLSETGLLRLLDLRTEHRRADYQVVKFKRWLLTEALPNVRRQPKTASN